MHTLTTGARVSGNAGSSEASPPSRRSARARLQRAPTNQQTHPTCWSSYNELAANALKKLVTPHLPASLKQLQSAVQKAHRDCANAERTAIEQARHTNAQADDNGEEEQVETDLGELDELDLPAASDEVEPADDANDR